MVNELHHCPHPEREGCAGPLRPLSLPRCDAFFERCVSILWRPPRSPVYKAEPQSADVRLSTTSKCPSNSDRGHFGLNSVNPSHPEERRVLYKGAMSFWLRSLCRCAEKSYFKVSIRGKRDLRFVFLPGDGICMGLQLRTEFFVHSEVFCRKDCCHSHNEN